MTGSQKLRAAVIGSGVAGLTTAIALRRMGVDTTVFERSTDLGKVKAGGGFIIWWNAIRALRKLDLADQVEAAGFPLERQEFLTSRGELLVELPVGELGRKYQTPTIGLSRPDLQRVLTDVLGDNIQVGAECTGFVQDETGVTAKFADGREERADLLIGADGINSAIRAQQLGATKPRYSGYTVWQGILDVASPLIPVGLFRVLWGRGTRFVIYQFDPTRLYWFAVANAPEGGKSADKNEILKHYAGWQEPTEMVIEKAAEGPGITRADIVDREPVSRWGEGRVTLVGDAAHPMTFNLGQGACQAIEDAVALTTCLRETSDVCLALRSYEGQRMPRTEAMTTQSWRIGRMGAWENPIACMLRDQFLKRVWSRFLVTRLEDAMAQDF